MPALMASGVREPLSLASGLHLHPTEFDIPAINGVRYLPWLRRPDYLATEDGEIIGPTGRVLRSRPNPVNGYLIVAVMVGGRARTLPVHVIVAEAWHGPRPPSHQVAHGIGGPTDNRPSNIRWATPRENAADKRLHGTETRGERNGAAQLTEAAVLTIRCEFAASRATQAALAQRFGVEPSTIALITRGKRWAHAGGPIVADATERRARRGEAHRNARLTANDVRAIRRSYAAREATQEALGARYAVGRSTIAAVVAGRTWGHVSDDPPRDV